MCAICILLDNSFPYPKALAVTLNEVKPSDDHMTEIAAKVYSAGNFKTLEELTAYHDEVARELFKLDEETYRD